MERQAQFIGPFRKRPGVQKPDRFCMIFSSTPNSHFKTKTNAPFLCCLLSFKQYLQVRINKMINGIDYHPSPSELISRIHPFRVLSLYFLNFLTNFCRYNCDKSSNLWCSDFHSCLPPGEILPQVLIITPDGGKLLIPPRQRFLENLFLSLERGRKLCCYSCLQLIITFHFINIAFDYI